MFWGMLFISCAFYLFNLLLRRFLVIVVVGALGGMCVIRCCFSCFVAIGVVLLVVAVSSQMFCVLCC